MKTILDPAIEGEIRARVARLRPDRPRCWGSMSASEMVCHLIDSFRVPLGETEARAKGSLLRFPPVRYLLIHLLPWPKGRIRTTPEYQETRPGEWERDVSAWNDALDRFLGRARSAEPRWSPSPAFGRLSTKSWGVLMYRHCDHHLRQFGV